MAALAVVVALCWVGPTPALTGSAIIAYSVIVAAAAALRGTLTVSVDPAGIEWFHGIGLVKSRVPWAVLRQVELLPLRLPQRGFPKGSWHGASARNVVRLELSDGRRELIRSSEPERLAAAIERHLEHARVDGAARAAAASGARPSRAFRWPRALAVALIAIAPAFAHEALSPWTRLKPAHLVVGTRWHRTLVGRQQIQDVQLFETMPRLLGLRERHSLGWNPAGRFLVEGVGEALVYLESGQPPYLLVRGPDLSILVNGRQSAQTERLYERLQEWTIGVR